MTDQSLVIENARILTMDPDQPRAEALWLSGGRIRALGSTAAIRDAAGAGVRRLDAQGGTLLPGFIESHMHVFIGGVYLSRLSLEGVFGFEAAAEKIRAFAATRPEDRLIHVQHASYILFGQEVKADRHILDRILPDRPLSLHAGDGHTVWANTKALELAGLLHGKPMPPGNQVVMGEDGLASGELQEPAAYADLLRHLPTGGRESLGVITGRDPDPRPDAQGRAQDKAAIAAGLAWCARHGITSIHNMDGSWYQHELLSELQEDGRLTAKIRLPYHHKNDKSLEDLRRDAVGMRNAAKGRLKSDFVKVFMDGVLESGTALVLEPYRDQPENYGLPMFSAEEFNQIAIEADRLGFQIAVHSIGDGAVRRTLDGYAAARAANGARDSRHRVEHVEMCHPDEVPRFKDLGAVASMQPLHAPGPVSYDPASIAVMVGDDRPALSFPWATLRAAGAPLVFSSDWPVSPVDPLRSIVAAQLRRPWRDGQPEEAQSLHQALHSYTAMGAWVEFAEAEKGMLKTGFAADLVLLDRDLESLQPMEMLDAKVRLTLIDGEESYSAG